MDPQGSILPKKKRKAKDKWKKNVIKKLRNSGLEYTSLKTKKVNLKKIPPTEVTCKCPFSCRSITVRLDYRQELFRSFYDLADYNKQQACLQRFVHPQLIKRRRYGKYDHPSESRRQHSFTYHLLLPGGSEVRVCLKTFCNTFGVTNRRIQLVGERILEGKMDATDQRGGQRKSLEKDKWTEKIIEHINSFPAEESHYARAKSENKRFLSPDLNVSRMYRAFKKKKYCPEYGEGQQPVTRQWYNEIFLTRFNLTFHKLRVDTCSTCDMLNMKLKAGDAAAKVEQEVHHRRAEAAFSAMTKDMNLAKTSSDTYVISFDLQQQMYLPQLTHTVMYYAQQLACCNLGIHDATKGQGFMSLWSENFGGRGSLEISSCVYTYITTEAHIGQKKKLVLWSDNCAGQNKNQYMLAMYLVLLAKGIFSEIIHKYPVKGHTFLSCDRDFAIIEKRKKKCKADTIKDLVEIIVSAGVKNPFSCRVFEEFHDFKSIAHSFLNTKTLGISTASEIRLTAERFGEVQRKKGFGLASGWLSGVMVLKENVSKDDFKNLQLPLSRSHFGVPQKKKADLRKMLPFLNPTSRQYFEEILAEEAPANPTVNPTKAMRGTSGT